MTDVSTRLPQDQHLITGIQCKVGCVNCKARA